MADTAVANACPDLITGVVLPACSPLKSVHTVADPSQTCEKLHDKAGSPKPESNGDVANGHATNGAELAQSDDGEVKDNTDGAQSSKSAHEAMSEGSPKAKEDSAAPEDCHKVDDSSKSESEPAKPVEPEPSRDESSKPEEASETSAKLEEAVEPAAPEDSANPEEQAAVSPKHVESAANPEASSPKPDQDVPAATSSEDSTKLVDVAAPDNAKQNEAQPDASTEGESEKPKDSEAGEGNVESPKGEKSKASTKSCSPF